MSTANRSRPPRPGAHAATKIKGRKRHLLTDTLGLLITAAACPANLQDRDAAAVLLLRARRRGRTRLARAWADNAYHGDLTIWAQHALGITIDIVHRPEDATTTGFTVLPRRWVIERTVSHLHQPRRLRQCYERSHRMRLAFLKLRACQLCHFKLTSF